MNSVLQKLIILSVSIHGLLGCGAPNKSAGDVAYLFEGESTTLQSKENSLCSTLQNRDEAPTTKNLSIDLGGCVDAGKIALEYKKIDGFYFVGLDGDAAKEEKVIHRSVRGQVWLNKSLLGFASAISGQMKKKAESGNNTGEVALGDSAKGQELQNVAKTTITVIEEPKIDVKDLSFKGLINFKVSGIIEADHDIEINGRLIENSFAVTVKTTADREYKQSIIKNFTAVILIVPHASDIYMDMFVDLNIHNPGLETLFKEQVNTFLSTGLKSAIDSLMNL